MGMLPVGYAMLPQLWNHVEMLMQVIYMCMTRLQPSESGGPGVQCHCGCWVYPPPARPMPADAAAPAQDAPAAPESESWSTPCARRAARRTPFQEPKRQLTPNGFACLADCADDPHAECDSEDSSAAVKATPPPSAAPSRPCSWGPAKRQKAAITDSDDELLEEAIALAGQEALPEDELLDKAAAQLEARRQQFWRAAFHRQKKSLPGSTGTAQTPLTQVQGYRVPAGCQAVHHTHRTYHGH